GLSSARPIERSANRAGVERGTVLLGALRRPLAEVQTLGHVDLDHLVGVTRGRRHRGEVLQAAGGGAELLEELAAGGVGDVFAVLVEFTGRDLVEVPPESHPMLADEQHVVTVVRQDGDSARVAEHVAPDFLARRRTEDHLFEAQEDAFGECPAGDDFELAFRAQMRFTASSMSTASRWRRRAKPASMSPAKRGCGSSGRLRNSGCACVPTKNGWSISSTNSTRLSSGDRPERRIPADRKSVV